MLLRYHHDHTVIPTSSPLSQRYHAINVIAMLSRYNRYHNVITLSQCYDAITVITIITRCHLITMLSRYNTYDVAASLAPEQHPTYYTRIHNTHRRTNTVA